MCHIKFDGHILLFFSNAYYFWQKVSSYWLYVPLLPINKALQNFQSGFTGHQ